jgi:hypothetical protein
MVDEARSYPKMRPLASDGQIVTILPNWAKPASMLNKEMTKTAG